MTDTKPFIDALKVDIMLMLKKEDLGVFELRRISNVTRAMVDLLNSVDNFQEHDGFQTAMRETADGKAPTLHQALITRTFDGESAFKAMYMDLLGGYHALEGARSDLNQLYERIGIADDSVAAKLGLPPLSEIMERHKKLIAAGDDGVVDMKLTAGEKDDE